MAPNYSESNYLRIIKQLVLIAALVLTLSSAGAAQEPDSSWQLIRPDGVGRASAIVDSVYVDKQLNTATVAAGDFTAYLMARLGATNLPPDFNYRVAIDPTQIRIAGRLSDLPSEARRSLTQLTMLFPPDSRVEARVTLLEAGKQAVRFHLDGVSVRGIPVPEAILQPVMANIGRQYPALTATGRDLYVAIPEGARMALLTGGVRLTGPTAP